MKTTVCLISLGLCIWVGRAQDTYVSGAEEAATPSVAYTSPVVYQAPVTYYAPVVYYAPVYYATAAVAAAANAFYPPPCAPDGSAPSTVVHITGGSGTYSYSSYGSCGSTVVYIGSRSPRMPAYRVGRYR